MIQLAPRTAAAAYNGHAYLLKECRELELENAELLAALAPFAAVMKAYHENKLDEVRPEWNDGLEHDLNYEMMIGRGGKHLLSLSDFERARAAIAAATAGQP